MNVPRGNRLRPRGVEELFPTTTAGFVAVANVDNLREQWKKTQLGQLVADLVIQPFVKDVRRQMIRGAGAFVNAWANLG